MQDPGKLFNNPGTGFIKAKDLFGNSLDVSIDKLRFRIGVYGILKKDNSILVQRHPYLDVYGLPGGGVELGENLEEALKREFEEETGIQVSVGMLIHAENTFFSHEDEHAHAVNLFYLVSKRSGKLKNSGNGEDTVEAKYMRLSELNQDTIQWAFTSAIKAFKEKSV